MKNLGETINNIMEENSSNRILILTNHLQIVGLSMNTKTNAKIATIV